MAAAQDEGQEQIIMPEPGVLYETVIERSSQNIENLTTDEFVEKMQEVMLNENEVGTQVPAELSDEVDVKPILVDHCGHVKKKSFKGFKGFKEVDVKNNRYKTNIVLQHIDNTLKALSLAKDYFAEYLEEEPLEEKEQNDMQDAEAIIVKKPEERGDDESDDSRNCRFL